jgi:hypothetical protein
MSDLKRLMFCALALATLLAMFVQTVGIRKAAHEAAAQIHAPMPAPAPGLA